MKHSPSRIGTTGSPIPHYRLARIAQQVGLICKQGARLSFERLTPDKHCMQCDTSYPPLSPHASRMARNG
jgi:hypothetical protein